MFFFISRVYTTISDTRLHCRHWNFLSTIALIWEVVVNWWVVYSKEDVLTCILMCTTDQVVGMSEFASFSSYTSSPFPLFPSFLPSSLLSFPSLLSIPSSLTSSSLLTFSSSLFLPSFPPFILCMFFSLPTSTLPPYSLKLTFNTVSVYTTYTPSPSNCTLQ